MNTLTLFHHILVSMTVRFNKGPNADAGGIEIHKDGKWYGICESNFDMNAAKVACRSIKPTFIDARVIPGKLRFFSQITRKYVAGMITTQSMIHNVISGFIQCYY